MPEEAVRAMRTRQLVVKQRHNIVYVVIKTGTFFFLIQVYTD